MQNQAQPGLRSATPHLPILDLQAHRVLEARNAAGDTLGGAGRSPSAFSCLSSPFLHRFSETSPSLACSLLWEVGAFGFPSLRRMRGGGRTRLRRAPLSPSLRFLPSAVCRIRAGASDRSRSHPSPARILYGLKREYEMPVRGAGGHRQTHRVEPQRPASPRLGRWPG